MLITLGGLVYCMLPQYNPKWFPCGNKLNSVAQCFTIVNVLIVYYKETVWKAQEKIYLSESLSRYVSRLMGSHLGN